MEIIAVRLLKIDMSGKLSRNMSGREKELYRKGKFLLIYKIDILLFSIFNCFYLQKEIIQRRNNV